MKLFDFGVNDFFVMNFYEYKREMFFVCWNLVIKDIFILSLWDGIVKLVCFFYIGICFFNDEIDLL